MIEQYGTLGDHVRVVVGDAGDSGTQLDSPGALGGRGDEDLGAGDDLAAGGVMLADPGLVVAELVEVHDQFQIALQRERWVLTGRVERCHEDSEVHGPIRPSLDRSVKTRRAPR